jgi:hypothetical protein
MKPAIAAVALLLAGAPVACLRAAMVAGLLLVVVPVQAYHHNVALTQTHRSPYRDIRDCLTPIVASEVSQGKAAPGVWVERPALSHTPFFYLRGLGPWQPRDHPSNQTVVMHLVVPQRYRPVLLSPERYADVTDWIRNDRAAALGRASVLSGVDTATLEASLEDATVGVTPLDDTLLLLPGPYAACGAKRLKLGSR